MKRFKHKRAKTDHERDILLTAGFCVCIVVGAVMAYVAV